MSESAIIRDDSTLDVLLDAEPRTVYKLGRRLHFGFNRFCGIGGKRKEKAKGCLPSVRVASAI